MSKKDIEQEQVPVIFNYIKNSGFTLIEVVLAILIFSIIALVSGRAILHSTRSTTNSFDRTRAEAELGNYLEQLKTEPITDVIFKEIEENKPTITVAKKNNYWFRTSVTKEPSVTNAKLVDIMVFEAKADAESPAGKPKLAHIKFIKIKATGNTENK